MIAELIQKLRCALGWHPESLQPIYDPTTLCCPVCERCWQPWGY